MPTRNVIHERANVHKQFHQAGENVETYIRTLYELASTCGFNAEMKTNTAIRDQLVVGISDRQTSDRQLLQTDLTLTQAIDMCRTSEQVNTQLASQLQATSSTP